MHNRREFLEQLGPGLGLVLAGYTATARGFAANETINVGCIGTGGRCRQLMQALKEVPGVRITAVCDVWDKHLRSRQEAGRRQARSPPRTITSCSRARTSTRCSSARPTTGTCR